MTNLAQTLQANTQARRGQGYLPPSTMPSTSEVARVKGLIESFTGTLDKVHAGITADIDAGKDEFSVHYDVKALDDAEQVAYGYLKRLTDSCFKSRDDMHLNATWGMFQAWAQSEGLCVHLAHHLPSSHNGVQVGGEFVRVSVYPDPFQ